MATAADDGLVHLWDVHTGQEIRQFSGHATSDLRDVAFSPDGRSLVSIGYDDTARLWDVATGEERLVIDVSSARIVIAFSPQGDAILTSTADGRARLWDVSTALNTGAQTGELVRDFAVSGVPKVGYSDYPVETPLCQ